jgi:hypothetical protein
MNETKEQLKTIQEMAEAERKSDREEMKQETVPVRKKYKRI